MATAYVLINCELGSEESIISQLKAISGVKEVHGTFGAYDILAKIESPTVEALREIITWKIRKIEKIRSTLTLMGIEVKEEELEQRRWEFEYVQKMAKFYKFWIEKIFSISIEVQADEMIAKSGGRFRIVDTPELLLDHESRGKDTFHFYLTYFRPLWTDCTCEGYFADNFGMVQWSKSPQKDDINYLMETNCPKVSHEITHELLRQKGYKNYKELVHDIWDKHLFASLPYEHYDINHKQTENDALFATLDTSSLRS